MSGALERALSHRGRLEEAASLAVSSSSEDKAESLCRQHPSRWPVAMDRFSVPVLEGAEINF